MVIVRHRIIKLNFVQIFVYTAIKELTHSLSFSFRLVVVLREQQISPWEIELQKLKEASSPLSVSEGRRLGAMSPSAMERSLSVVYLTNLATWIENHTH